MIFLPVKNFGEFLSTHITSHNIRQKKVVHYCTQKHSDKCKCGLKCSWDRVIGVVDFENPVVVGEHIFSCAVSNNIPNLDTPRMGRRLAI